MSLIGKEIGKFRVMSYHNGAFRPVSNESLRGKWAVFVFYPADFTFICPTELADLANLYDEFKKINCEVYSISTDSEFVHKAWHDVSDLVSKVQYPMLSDSNHQLSEEFEVLVKETGVALRGSFIINPHGKIVAYEINDSSIGRDASELLRKVQAAQYVANNGDQVCPAKWKPGDDTLCPDIALVGKL